MPEDKQKAGPSPQSEHFKEAARQAETDDDPEAFERMFGKIVPPIVPRKPDSKKDD